VATEKGTFVEPAKVTVGQFVSDRVDQWEAAGSITARTASRYRDLVRCQIIPFIGTKQIQKLTTLDIEQWHGTLKTSGRANGKGGLAARSIGHCHRLLRAALRDSTKHGLTVKNVALAQSAPKVKTAEKVIVRDVPAFIESLRRDSRLFVPGMVALFTGMRLVEVLALRWSRVDLERKTIEVKEAVEQIANDEIRIKGPKTVAGVRTITLPDVLVETLRQHRKEQQELRLKLGVGRLPDDALLFASVDGSLESASGTHRPI